MKTVIVDDDQLQLELIGSYIDKTNFLEKEGAFTDPLVALEFIVNNRPDLLFVDIEMPGLTGFELLESLDTPPATIILTGKSDYAAEAFSFDVIDYLVKPIDSYPRFLKAVNKVKRKSGALDKYGEEESLYVKENSLLIKLALRDIIYFEAYGDYVKIGTVDKTHVIHSTLSKIASRLDDHFIRVHRSYIVRLSEIDNIDHTNIQVGEKIIPVSKSYKSDLMNRIDVIK